MSENIKNETKESIRKKMIEVDARGWMTEMSDKSSVKIYRKWRRAIGGQEEIYNNDQASVILFKSRTNNLRLNDRKRFWDGSTIWDLCGSEREDLKHFMLWCPANTQERRKSERLQQPYPEEEDNVIGK